MNVLAVHLILWVLLTPLARADDSAQADCPRRVDEVPEARQSFVHGERLYAAGHYEQAVVAYAAAYQSSKQPQLLFNLANAYERMGERTRAAGLLERYLRCARPADSDLVAERVRRLRQSTSTFRLRPPICPIARPEPPTDAESTIDMGSSSPVDDGPSPVPWLVTGAGLFATSAIVAMTARTSAWTCGGDKADCVAGRPPRWTEHAERVAAAGAVLGGGALLVGGLLLIRPEPSSPGWHIAPMASQSATGLVLSTPL